MSIHASQRERNIIRSLMVALMAIDLAGALLLADGDERAPGTDVASWVRVSLLPLSASDLGRAGGVLTTREDILVSCEVWHRGAQFDGASQVDAVEAPVEALKHFFTARNVALCDYVTDPTGGTPIVGATLRFFTPPIRRWVAPSDGYQRRLVLAQGTYFSSHTG